MATINISDLNPVIDLTDSEMSKIGGGNWLSDKVSSVYNAVSGGVKRFGQGSKDHAAQSSPRHDDLWYNIGYSLSDYI